MIVVMSAFLVSIAYLFLTIEVDILDSHTFYSPYSSPNKIIADGQINLIQHRYIKGLKYYSFYKKTRCRATNKKELKKFKNKNTTI